MIKIEEAARVDAELIDAIAGLLPLLSKSAPAPTADELAAIVDSPASTLFLARDGEGGPVVGTLTLVVFRIPTGVRAWIEDVIVSDAVRGRGLRCGEHLTNAALDKARGAGAKTVDLTSRHTRQDAHRLYERVGFKTRETNVYRYDLAD